jgi:hypothetical protein
MDLYRQAAERFEVAGDVRHEEVVTHMRKFLALPLTASILEGTYKKPEGEEPISRKSDVSGIAEGVILEAGHLDEDDDNEGDNTPSKPPKRRTDSEDKAFEENMDSILLEAEADLADFRMDDDDPALDAMLEAGGELEVTDESDDAIADFENMLKEADNELAELMNS